MTNTTIYFDMDGTIAGLYEIENWLHLLRTEKTKPYREAAPLINMRKFGKLLNQLKKRGYSVGIISALSGGNPSPRYLKKICQTKMTWLKRHISAVVWDEIVFVPYGTNKAKAVRNPCGILFDDDIKNRDDWQGQAYDETRILEVLTSLL